MNISESLIPRPTNGEYISFEGICGSGKTYYLKILSERHHGKFYPALEFPNQGIGAKIVEILRSGGDEFFRQGYPITEALLVFAMKLFELERAIVPQLAQGKMVIEDRSADTNCLYAAILLGDRCGEGSMYSNYQRFMEIRKQLGPMPERVICFMPDFSLSVERMQERDKRRLTESELSFLRKAEQGYLELSERDRERFTPVNPDDQSTDQTISQLEGLLNLSSYTDSLKTI